MFATTAKLAYPGPLHRGLALFSAGLLLPADPCDALLFIATAKQGEER